MESVGDDDDDDEGDEPASKKVSRRRCSRGSVWPRSSTMLTRIIQARFSSGMRENEARINQQYPEGCCGLPAHAEVQCFFHRPTERHFVLDDNMKKVWAARMVSILPHGIQYIILIRVRQMVDRH